MEQTKKKTSKSTIGLIIALVVIVGFCIAFNAIYDGKFLTLRNINSVLIHAIIQTFIAWALCFADAAGFMDLSIGSVVVLAGFLAGELGNRLGYPGVLIGGLVVGVVLTFLNYFIFACSRIPAWIAGLGLAMAYEGIGIAYSNSMVAVGKTVVLMDPSVTGLSAFPWVYVLFAVAFVFVYMIYNKTTTGLHLRAIGGNQGVAKAMGINTRKTILMIAIVSGILVGLGGLVNQSYAGRIFAKSGLTSLNLIFKPMATLMLAQIVRNKINIVIAMPIAAIVIYVIFNMLTIAGVASGTLQEAILGLCVIVFAAIAQRNAKGVVK